MNKFKNFSKKQKLILNWWTKKQYENCCAIICDGAIRSGKTICMAISFIFWAVSNFSNQHFAICGKTIPSVKRNVIEPLVEFLLPLGFSIKAKFSENLMNVKFKNKTNVVYFFGGKDESSAAHIQGLTLAGIMMDEVALMPRSFVEQAIARCSVPGSKFWFNCNPGNPFHWFYNEWIKKAEKKNTLYLHLTMKDNPSLSKKIIKRYENLYSGAFYARFIKGSWTAADGQIYTMFSSKRHIVEKLPENFDKYIISGDYGIVNPTSFGLWGKSQNKWYRIKEFYHDSRKENKYKTDEEYYSDLENLAKNLKIDFVIIDPSASSFIECIRQHGKFKVIKARNDVISGINLVCDALNKNMIAFHKSCQNSIREFSLYSWDKTKNYDFVKKENDHAMDDIRYFVSSIFKMTVPNFYAISTKR